MWQPVRSDAFDEPIRLPEHEWDRPEIVQACRQRQPGPLLRAAHRYGNSQTRIAAVIGGMDQGEVSRLINNRGARITTLERWQRIADALDMPDRVRLAVGLPARGGSPTPAPDRGPATRTAPQHDSSRPRSSAPARALPQPTGLVANSAMTGSGAAGDHAPGQLDHRSLVAAVAAESARFGKWAEVTNVGAFTIDQLHADLRELARTYLTEPPLPVMLGVRAIRDEATALLSGHQYPRQARDLYAMAGYACTLLAWIAGDLGQPAAADTHGRAAWLCAELADSPELRAWVLSTRSKTAFWAGQHREAVAYSQRGQAIAPPTSVAVLLAAQEADAWAEIGATARARDSIHAARAARDRLADSDDIGGLLSCGLTREANYSAGVHLRVGDPDTALAETDTALGAYDTGNQRSYGTEAQIHITRATSYLLKDQLDGVTDALRPVLALPTDHRLHTVTRRLTQLGHVLTRPRLARSVDAAALRAEIESYRAETAVSTLPAETRAAGRTRPVTQQDHPAEPVDRMRDHWWWRPGWKLGRSFYTWHLTFDNTADVHRLAHDYLSNLNLPGLDHIPDRWLHLTMQGIGFTDEVPTTDVDRIVEAVRQRCKTLRPFEITLGPATVDPEVIRLKVTPAQPVEDLRMAIRRGIADVWGADGVPEPAAGFQPHVSLAYSSGTGPADPVQRAVAAHTPRPATSTVTEAQLIILNRDHREYQWTTYAAVRLG
jgi:2'-5' RNA ligase